MSGLATLNSWLKNNDPYKYVDKIYDIYLSYNTKSRFNIIDKIKHWWIEKVSYPLLRYKIIKSQRDTAILLYDHPDFVVFIITRFLVSLQAYTNRIKDLTPKMVIEQLFPNKDVIVNMKVLQMPNSYQVQNYSIFVRSLIPTVANDIKGDKISITNLEVDVLSRTYVINQKVYDTNKVEELSTAKVLYYKEFRLDEDGKLSNPNYILDRSLLDDDLIYYKLMISQLMIFVGGMFDTITTIYFIDLDSQNKK